MAGGYSFWVSSLPRKTIDRAANPLSDNKIKLLCALFPWLTDLIAVLDGEALIDTLSLAAQIDSDDPMFCPSYASHDKQVSQFRSQFAEMRSTQFPKELLPVNSALDKPSYLAYLVACEIIKRIPDLQSQVEAKRDEAKAALLKEASSILGLSINNNDGLKNTFDNLIITLKTCEGKKVIDNTASLSSKLEAFRDAIKNANQTANATAPAEFIKLQQRQFSLIQMISYRIARQLALLDKEILDAQRKNKDITGLMQRKASLEQKWLKLNDKLINLTTLAPFNCPPYSNLLPEIRKNISKKIQAEFYPEFDIHVQRVEVLIATVKNLQNIHSTDFDTSEAALTLKDIKKQAIEDCTSLPYQYSRLYSLGLDLRNVLQSSLSKTPEGQATSNGHENSARAKASSSVESTLATLGRTASRNSMFLMPVRRIPSQASMTISQSDESLNSVGGSNLSLLTPPGSGSAENLVSVKIGQPQKSTSLKNQIDDWLRKNNSSMYSDKRKTVKDLTDEIDDSIQKGDLAGTIATVAGKKAALIETMGDYGFLNWVIHPITKSIISSLDDLLTNMQRTQQLNDKYDEVTAQIEKSRVPAIR